MGFLSGLKKVLNPLTPLALGGKLAKRAMRGGRRMAPAGAVPASPPPQDVPPMMEQQVRQSRMKQRLMDDVGGPFRG